MSMKSTKHIALPAAESETIGAAMPAEEGAELRALYAEIAELRAKGIISDGEGPRGSLRPVAYLPGVVARFLDERG